MGFPAAGATVHLATSAAPKAAFCVSDPPSRPVLRISCPSLFEMTGLQLAWSGRAPAGPLRSRWSAATPCTRGPHLLGRPVPPLPADAQPVVQRTFLRAVQPPFARLPPMAVPVPSGSATGFSRAAPATVPFPDAVIGSSTIAFAIAAIALLRRRPRRTAPLARAGVDDPIRDLPADGAGMRARAGDALPRHGMARPVGHG